MKHKLILIIIPVVLLLLGLFGSWWFSRETVRTYSVGVINYSPAAEISLQGFKTGMTNLGYLEGKNIQYIYTGFITDKDQLQEEAKRLIALDIDLLLAMSTPATLIAKDTARDKKIPVLFAPVSSAVSAGIVKGMVEHEDWITGVTFGPQEPRRLELIKKLVPKAKKIYVPYNPNDKSPVLGIDRLRPAADKLGLMLVLKPIMDEAALDTAIKSFNDDMDAIFLPTDSLMVAKSAKFIELAIRHKIPLTCPQREGVEEGALFSYGFSIWDIGEQAARLADQILNGVSPGELPVEFGEFILTLNLATAESIGLEIPDNILRQAQIVNRQN